MISVTSTGAERLLQHRQKSHLISAKQFAYVFIMCTVMGEEKQECATRTSSFLLRREQQNKVSALDKSVVFPYYNGRQMWF